MTSPSRNHLKELSGLQRRKGRREHCLFLVEGPRSVEAALAAGAPLVEILVEHEFSPEERLAARLEASHLPIHHLARKDMDHISDVKQGQGVVAVSRSVAQDSFDGLEGTQTILALDAVQDPGNVGALIRTAAWFGVETVLAGPGTADFESPKVVRASMGGLWDVALVRSDDLGAALERFAQGGIEITGADLRGLPAKDWKPSRSGILVLGSEAHGLSDSVRATLTERVTLAPGRPAEGRGVESLNVVVAGGILMEQWLGERAA